MLPQAETQSHAPGAANPTRTVDTATSSRGGARPGAGVRKNLVEKLQMRVSLTVHDEVLNLDAYANDPRMRALMIRAGVHSMNTKGPTSKQDVLRFLSTSMLRPHVEAALYVAERCNVLCFAKLSNSWGYDSVGQCCPPPLPMTSLPRLLPRLLILQRHAILKPWVRLCAHSFPSISAPTACSSR
jgi:hypothetical protein